VEKILVPAHFAEELEPAAKRSGALLVPYDREGAPLGDSAGSTAMFRWWLSPAQGDAILRAHPDVRWLHTGSAGVDHILTPLFLSSGIVLTNSSGVHAPSIAEWVVAAILAFAKDLRRIFDRQRGRSFESIERDELGGKTALIAGAGRIGSEIAKRLRPFGVRTVAVRRSGGDAPGFDTTIAPASLSEAARDATWLIVAVPLTAETADLIDRRVIEALPPEAVVVNVARGEVVDEDALVEALASKKIGGAILDVFRKEPLPPEHPLWDLENVLILPHTTWRSPRVRQRQLDLMAENMRRFTAGEPLLNVVDFRRGY
jgi:phosphoglycerate dehydrogenase-like enzyme